MGRRIRKDVDARPVAERAAAPHADLRAAELAVEGERFLVLSRSLPAVTQLPAVLTTAEAAVVQLLLRGASNEAIATARRSSVRTVANQLASIYRKLDVRSRGELAARLSQS